MLDGNKNPDLKTFLVYVPRVGAEEADVPAAAELVTGGNPSHYWEDSGMTGYKYQETLGIGVYAYDVWMVYGPGARWEGELPPKPDFWMQNLWGVDDKLVPHLDSKKFSEQVDRFLKRNSDGRTLHEEN